MGNGLMEETRLSQKDDHGGKGRKRGFGELGGEEELVKVVELVKHFGLNEDAGDDGDRLGVALVVVVGGGAVG
uniref:Uncharacterized protein n=1 Tax=Rhizophora mucronata TaxID=61149 RepID=A0A2P2QAW7_RHIMU